jgi:unspecific monooxygenase
MKLAMKHPPLVDMPRWKQLYQWTFEPLKFLDECAARYGDSFVSHFSENTQPWWFVSHPQAIAEIFAQSDKFDSGRFQGALKPSMGETSSILLDGEPHRRRRQLLMPPFHGERLRTFGHIMRRCAEDVLDEWSVGDNVVMLPVLNDITLQVILQAVFGLSKGEQYDQLTKYLRDFLLMAASPLAYGIAFYPALLKSRGFWRPTESYMWLRNRVDEILYDRIRSQRHSFDPNQPDILTLLLLAKDENGESLSDVEVRDELMTLLLAGHDSSASTLAWVLYWIHSHPEVLSRLVEEIDQVGADADPMAIAKLPYLSAVCSESLRLRSAGPTIFVRVANVPVKIMDYEIAPDTILYPCQYLTHHREDLYPEPREFRPERFLERQYAPSEYYPLGGADRYCIGGAFALYEMKLVIATILRRYRLQLVDRPPIKSVRRGVNIAPAGGVKLRVLETRSPQARPNQLVIAQ